MFPINAMSVSAVALRKESVDRNNLYEGGVTMGVVALRKESVDRNLISTLALGGWGRVALRKESVDRNSDGVVSGSADYGRSPQGERG